MLKKKHTTLNYKIYLKDILEAISKIEKSTKDISKEKFKRNAEIWDATLMRLQIIGESIKKIPNQVKRRNKNVEWEKMARVRDIISHTYFRVNVDIIWDVLKNKIPKLKKEIRKIYWQ